MAIKQQQFDLVFMDCEMPIMDGYEATRQIRRLPEDDQPWIVGISAHALEEQINQALKAGMDRYLTKPLRATTLQETLAELTSQVRQA